MRVSLAFVCLVLLAPLASAAPLPCASGRAPSVCAPGDALRPVGGAFLAAYGIVALLGVAVSGLLLRPGERMRWHPAR